MEMNSICMHACAGGQPDEGVVPEEYGGGPAVHLLAGRGAAFNLITFESKLLTSLLASGLLDIMYC